MYSLSEGEQVSCTLPLFPKTPTRIIANSYIRNERKAALKSVPWLQRVNRLEMKVRVLKEAHDVHFERHLSAYRSHQRRLPLHLSPHINSTVVLLRDDPGGRMKHRE